MLHPLFYLSLNFQDNKEEKVNEDMTYRDGSSKIDKIWCNNYEISGEHHFIGV